MGAMRRGVLRPAALSLLVVLAGALVGPCLCDPRPVPASASHACCGTEAGVKAAAPDCCACLAAPPARVAVLSGGTDLLALALAAPAPVALLPALPAVALALARTVPEASPPPIRLRI